MGYSLGYDSNWQRDIGYGVIAFCDHPGCGKEIDRGLGYVCGGEPRGGERGCGLYFCGRHMFIFSPQLCERCKPRRGHKPFKPALEHPLWVHHKLTHDSWQQWRDENPKEVEALREKYSETLSRVPVLDLTT